MAPTVPLSKTAAKNINRRKLYETRNEFLDKFVQEMKWPNEGLRQKFRGKQLADLPFADSHEFVYHVFASFHENHLVWQKKSRSYEYMTYSTLEGYRAALIHQIKHKRLCNNRTPDMARYVADDGASNPFLDPTVLELFKYFQAMEKDRKSQDGVERAVPLRVEEVHMMGKHVDAIPDDDWKVKFHCRLVYTMISLGFYCAMRLDEPLNLMLSDIVPLTDENGWAYYRVHLRFRKWMDPNKNIVDGQHLNVYSSSGLDDRHLDTFDRLDNWYRYMSALVKQRGLDPASCYLFPSHSEAKGTMKFTDRMVDTTLQQAVKVLYNAARVQFPAMSNKGDIITFYSCRRGGAQYRLYYATGSARFTLHTLKWWCGWSGNEDCATLLKYVVENMSRYEQSYSDILSPSFSENRRRLKMGLPTDPVQESFDLARLMCKRHFHFHGITTIAELEERQTMVLGQIEKSIEAVATTRSKLLALLDATEKSLKSQANDVQQAVQQAMQQAVGGSATALSSSLDSSDSMVEKMLLAFPSTDDEEMTTTNQPVAALPRVQSIRDLCRLVETEKPTGEDDVAVSRKKCRRVYERERIYRIYKAATSSTMVGSDIDTLLCAKGITALRKAAHELNRRYSLIA